MDVQKLNEFEYKLGAIYLIFIIQNLNATVLKQYFKFYMID